MAPARSTLALLLLAARPALAAAAPGSLRGGAAAAPPVSADANATEAVAGSPENVTLGASVAASATAADPGYWPKEDICSWLPWLSRCQGGTSEPMEPTTPAPEPEPAGDSCAANGCGPYRPELPCQCNDACVRWGSCCSDYSDTCPSPEPTTSSPPSAGGGKVMTLYHQTSTEIGPLILEQGFKPGKEGWCGGAIYFAATPEATYSKAIGPDSHQGYIIEAEVDLGLMLEMSKTCDRSMTGTKLSSLGYDSITFNPGDGDEFVVYDASRVVSTRQYQ